jgi:hypothetical protein
MVEMSHGVVSRGDCRRLCDARQGRPEPVLGTTPMSGFDIS